MFTSVLSTEDIGNTGPTQEAQESDWSRDEMDWVSFHCNLCSAEYNFDNGHRGCRWLKVTLHRKETWVCYRCVRPLWKEIRRGCPSGSWEAFEYRHRAADRDAEFWARLKEEIYRSLAAEDMPVPTDDEEDLKGI